MADFPPFTSTLDKIVEWDAPLGATFLVAAPVFIAMLLATTLWIALVVAVAPFQLAWWAVRNTRVSRWATTIVLVVWVAVRLVLPSHCQSPEVDSAP